MTSDLLPSSVLTFGSCGSVSVYTITEVAEMPNTNYF